MLGPLLFILYINDLANLQLGSKMVVYADDNLLYRLIETNADYNLMQEDVTSIEQWMTDNSLTLNATKCKQMLMTRSKTYHHPQLYLSGQPLEEVQSYKYLGVIITSDLSWSVHIQSICLKSRRLVGLLYRQFYDNANSNTLRQFYLSCIRPHLEYACTVWDPHLAKEITLLENVQKFAYKICCKSWLMDYDSMLAYLDIPSLQQRRLQLKANLMYQFVHKDSFIPEGLLLSHPPSITICEPFPISLYLMPEQMLTIIIFFHTCSAFGIVYQYLLYVHQVALCLRKLYCRTLFSSLGSCTGLTYSLLTLSYVHLINLFNYFIVYFILSMFLYSCATFS